MRSATVSTLASLRNEPYLLTGFQYIWGKIRDIVCCIVFRFRAQYGQEAEYQG